ncbi:MAG: cytidylate kinase-like family protein [Chloroflexi bacterium]|nr:cytidylate kinase-like family protein [Chloroflexota bacterium]
MTITIGGQAGAGGHEIGAEVSRKLGLPLVRTLAIRKLARRLDASVDAVVRKELGFGNKRIRFANALEYGLYRSTMYGGDPHLAVDFGFWAELQSTKKHLPNQISTSEYRDAFYAASDDLRTIGDSVVVKRAGCLSLADSPGVVHIGIFAPRDQRERRLSQRMQVGIGEASKLIRRFDTDRRAWFSKLAETEPEDRSLYDIVVDVDLGTSDSEIADQIVKESIQFKYDGEVRPALAF